MTKPSYRITWEKRFRDHRESAVRLSKWNPFDGWENSRAPEKNAEHHITDALQVLYGGDANLACRFLEHSLSIAQRALSENKVESPQCRDKFPGNRGSLLRTQAYAEFLLGRPLNEGMLSAASTDIENSCAGFPKHKWDDFQEAQYLQAIRPALIAGELETARRLFQRRRVFRSNVEEFELLKVLAADVPILDDEYRTRFDAFFDLVRDPAYDPQDWTWVPILRFELGLIRDKYLIDPNRKIDWRRAVDAIAE